MKKIGAAVCAVIIGATALFSFTACNLFKTSSDDNYPYDVAAANGYQGTEASWLASYDVPSTRERQWYEEAKKDGYPGSYLDFLNELNSVNGDDTAYINSAIKSVVSVYAMFSATYSTGAGVIYSLDTAAGDAYIVTNYHVVFGNKRISNDIFVYLYGSETYNGTAKGSGAITATYVGGASSYDLAVLKVTGSALLKATGGHTVTAQAAVGGNSDAVTLGERVYAIGNPEGEGISVVGGIVSVDYEEISCLATDDKTEISLPEIRTDAPLNHGNSGGGLFNAKGELIGIVNARTEDEGNIVGMGYALPANFALAAAENIIDNHGSLNLARIGITVSTTESKAVYDEKTAKCFIEEKVVVMQSDCPGLETGDTLSEVTLTSSDGRSVTVAITRQYKLRNLLLNVRRGDSLKITFSREGVAKETKVNFADLKNFRTIV